MSNKHKKYKPKFDGLTYQEIGDIMDISRERVRQILEGALVKIRKEMKRKNLTFEDLMPSPVSKDHNYSLMED